MKGSQRLGAIFLLPSFLFVAIFSIFPIVESFRLSFHRLILTLPWLGQKMVGWENYTDLVSDPVALAATMTTVIFIGVTVSLELLFGLAIALHFKRSLSRPEPFASSRSHSMGNSDSGFFANVAFHI